MQDVQTLDVEKLVTDTSTRSTRPTLIAGECSWRSFTPPTPPIRTHTWICRVLTRSTTSSSRRTSVSPGSRSPSAADRRPP